MQETNLTPTRRPQLQAPERNRYYYGMLLDVFHFNREETYISQKFQTLCRMIFGYGVICGLDVQPGPETDQVMITPGMAIDKWGNIIVVPVKTAPITIPPALLHRDEDDEDQDKAKSTPEQKGKSQRQRDRDRDDEDDDDDIWLHVLLCYHECEADPAPVLAGDCGSEQECEPSTIREQFRIVFREGALPQPSIECRFPDVYDDGRLDYGTLARFITHNCPEPPNDPCIPLANIRIEVGKGHHCEPENIDITVRPIVYSNDVLYDLVLGLLGGEPQQRHWK